MNLYEITSYEMVNPEEYSQLVVRASSVDEALEIAAGEAETSDAHWAFGSDCHTDVTLLGPDGLKGIVLEA